MTFSQLATTKNSKTLKQTRYLQKMKATHTSTTTFNALVIKYM